MVHQLIDANIELHVHPFLNSNGIADVIDAMDKNKLDVLALEALDDTLYPLVLQETAKLYGTKRIKHDQAGIRLPHNRYLLNAREYSTKENLHVLTVGYAFDEATPKTEIRKIIDKGLEHNALVVLDHPFVDNGKTITAGHISQEMEESLEKLCKEYSGKIALEWNGYCIPWMRKFLQITLNCFGQNVLYHDVNEKVKEFSNKVKLPVLADTDLHARKKRHLKFMGRARFITDVEGECASEIVYSMKKNIFSGNYQNIEKYVTAVHLLEAFCFQILFRNYVNKARG